MNLHSVFNMGIALAYLLIPIGLLSLAVRVWAELPPLFRCTLFKFSLFVLSCAIGHLLDALGAADPVLTVVHGFTFAISALVAVQMPVAANEIVRFIRRSAVLHRELEQSESRFHAFMSNSPAICWMVNREGTFYYCNRLYAREVFDRPPSQVIGSSLRDLFPEPIADVYLDNNDEVFERGERLETIEPVPRPDGTIGTYLIHKFLVTNDILGGVGLNITEREQLRQDLEKTNQELEQFAYAASHDLRTPLRGIAGLVAILKRRLEGQLEDKELQILRQIHNDCNYATELVNGILMYSRVERLGNPFECFDVDELLTEVCDRLAPLFQESHASIEWAEMPEICGDRVQMSQIFENLISNAIKYRSEDPPIIYIRAERTPIAWVFSVEDNGIGIDPQYQDSLFIMFSRLHSRTEIEGTGIGLAIVRKIAERHGGLAWLSSQGAGHGSTFYFSIPYEQNNPPASG